MDQQISCQITGRVQMVMFRDFAQRKARILGLSGWVKNKPDGSVSIVAQGDEEALKKYLGHLDKGPILSSVDRVEVAWGEPSETFKDFTILY